MTMSDAAGGDNAFAEVGGRHGRFRFGRHDAIIGASLAAYGEYSEIELRLLLQLFKPGATVVEAGANIGAHTVPIARRLGPSGRLIVYEPQPVICDVLRDNLALNGIGNVEVRAVALGATEGDAWIAVPDYAVPGNFGAAGLVAAGNGHRVPRVRLDDEVGARKVHLLKIDVEGAECEVLDGAASLIARDRPLIYVENDRVERSAALIRRLFDLDYRACWDMPPLYNPDNHFGNADNRFEGIVSVNMLCLPRERRVGELACEVTDPDFHPMRAGGVTP